MSTENRAITFDKFGEPAEVLSVGSRPRPTPQSDEVLLRMQFRPINPSDMATIRGFYGRLPKLPAVPGMEGMGVIEAIGEKVSGFEAGQRVIPLGMNGTWQTYGTINAQQLVPVHPNVSDEAAAQFVANPVSAWVMLTQALALKEGDWLLQTAAGSTLGRLVLQLAKLKGYKTVNFVRRREQVDELLALGADAVICTADDDVVEQVKSVTGGGATGAIEAVGGATGALAASSLRPGGKMLVYGQLSGEPTALNWGEMLFRGTIIEGWWLTHWFRATPQPQILQSLIELMTLMANGDLTPPVEATYDLADIVAAVTHSETPGRSGKVLLTG